MCMAQEGKPSVHQMQVQLNILFYGDRDEKDCGSVLDNLIRDHNDGHARRPGI